MLKFMETLFVKLLSRTPEMKTILMRLHLHPMHPSRMPSYSSGQMPVAQLHLPRLHKKFDLFIIIQHQTGRRKCQSLLGFLAVQNSSIGDLVTESFRT